MAKKALLMILDGWGCGDRQKDDVIFNTPTPYWDSLLANYPHSQLQASGENVGLPDGQMGNSEVGHLNIGAGRIVYQDLVKINRACADNSIMQNKEVVAAFSYAKEHGKNIHFMGLTSNGGVHSSLEHLFKLCDIAKEYGLENTFIHCFMDGRDTDPKSGKGFIEQLTAHCEKSAGKIASIVGRFYAMDRDKRWARVKEAYDLLVNGTGKKATDMVQAMQESYDEGVTDEFIKPISNANFDGTIKEGDVVIFFNYRNDRAKELTIVLTQQDMPEEGMKTIPGLQYYCMTPYDASFKGVHILFDKENVQNTLGEYLASNGKTQLHIAETEKYAHVTFFFNGGRETPYDNEDRILVPSPKVATYDLKPEMSAYEVKDKLVEAIGTQKYDFIVVNYANGDMVGHTGIYEAIEKAVVAIDNCVKDTVEAAKANGYEVIIIADHGNADHALNEDGTPNTAHSLNPVPFVYVTENKDAKVENGVLHMWSVEEPDSIDNGFGKKVKFSHAGYRSVVSGKQAWCNFTENMRIEIRFKRVAAEGFNDALWFMGNKGPWPKNGEIDLLENPKKKINQRAHFTLHSENHYAGVVGGEGSVTSTIDLADMSQWNIYWLEWYPDRIIGGVNGKAYFEHKKGDNGNTDWPWSNPAGFYVIFSTGLSVNPNAWPGAVNPAAWDKQNPPSMYIDWIRVYVNDNYAGKKAPKVRYY